MKLNRITAIVFLLLFVAALLVFGSNRPLQAQQGDTSPEVLSKIDQVLSVQREILQKLDSMQKQLEQIQLYTNKL